MSIMIHTYRFATELEEPLKEIHHEHKDLIFIVPSKEDKNLLLEILSIEGLAHDFPAIWRWGDLYGGLADILRRLGIRPPIKRQLDPPDHWLVVRHLVQNTLRTSKDLTDAIPAIRQPGFIETIGKQLHELIGEDVPQEDLAMALSCKNHKRICTCDDKCPNSINPTGFLCNIYGKYFSYLDENDLADSAQIPLLSKNLLLEFEQLRRHLKNYAFVLVGFMSFMKSQHELLRVLDEIGVAIDIYKPDPAMGQSFYDVEQQFAESATICKISKQDKSANLHLIACGDSRQELETLARNIWFAVEKGCFSFSDMAIEIPASYRKITEEVLDVYRIPWTFNSGTLLSETLCWDLLMRLKKLKDENWPFSFVFRFFFSPFLGFNLSDELLELLNEEMPSGIKEWRDFLRRNDMKDLLNIIEACDSFFNDIKEGINAEKLFEKLFELLSDIIKVQEKVQDLITDPKYDETLFETAKFLEAIERKALFLKESLPSLGSAQRDLLSESEAWEFLYRFAEETRLLPPKKQLNSITLYIDNSPVLATHSLYTIVNATTEKWPGKIIEPPLLNDEARMMIHENTGLAGVHLPLRHERRQQLEALFRRHLCSGTDATWITCSVIDTQGKPRKLSSFLEGALKDGLCKVTGKTERPLSKLLPKGETYLRESEVPQDKLSRRRRKPVVKVKPKFKGYLSDIDTWTQCPALYAYKSILNLYQPRDAGFDPQRCGILFHQLWQKAWNKRLTCKDSSLATCIEKLWEQTVKSVYPSLLNNKKLFRHNKRLYAQAKRLALIQEGIKSNLGNFSISQYWEVELPTMHVDAVSFVGRADRIDCLNEKGQILWDYKTGGSHNYESSLQLAAYASAFMKNDIEIIGALYLCHGNSMCIGHVSKEYKDFIKALVPEDFPENFKIKREKLEDIAKRAEEALTKWAEDLMSGSFEPHYDPKTCQECQYKTFCRKSEIGGEERQDNE